MRTFSAQVLNGVAIFEHWIDENDAQRSLARLDAKAGVKAALEHDRALDGARRKLILELFDEVVAELTATKEM